MELYVGTSGYSYKEWKGTFYPKDLPASQMLRFYGEHFRSVESNDTFRRIPEAATLQKRAESVPANFKFVLKAPQKITHIKRLKDTSDLILDFLEAAAVLKKRRGPLLFQLPHNMKKDAPRLGAFLASFPAKCRTAFEFRHESWFDDEIFGLLRKHKVALCIADAEGDLGAHFRATTNWGYLRLRRPDYDDKKLKEWLKRMQEQDWKEAFVFFKHEDEGKGPQFAQRFLDLAK